MQNDITKPQKPMGTNIHKAILHLLLAAFFFSLMTFFVRISGDLPTMQKAFFRNFFALLIATGSILKNNVGFSIRKGNGVSVLMRCLFGTSGMIANFWAIDRLGIADANMLNKLSPFFAIIFSAMLLRERANRFEWGAVIIAMCGAMLVVKPTFSAEAIPALAGFCGGLGAGLAYANVRVLGVRGENSMLIVTFFSAFTCAMLLPNILFNYTPMTGEQWLFLILTGIAAAGGQIFITKAYSRAPAKDISVFDFSIVIFAAVLGFCFLNQIPDLFSVLGYLVIIGTAVTKYIVLRKKNQRADA